MFLSLSIIEDQSYLYGIEIKKKKNENEGKQNS